jgi:Uma2 family endonuclease
MRATPPVDPSAAPTPSAPRVLTVADLAALPDGPERYELHKGVLVIMPPPGFIHGNVEGNFISAFKVQGEYPGHGLASCGESTLILSRNPDTVFGMDTAFCSNRSGARLSSEGYLESIPDIVVEVRSKNDTMADLRRKAAEYLAVGVRIVWLADRDARNVIELRADVPERIFTEDETLTLEDDIIPGFQLTVRRALGI